MACVLRGAICVMGHVGWLPLTGDCVEDGYSFLGSAYTEQTVSRKQAKAPVLMSKVLGSPSRDIQRWTCSRCSLGPCFGPCPSRICTSIGSRDLVGSGSRDDDSTIKVYSN